MGFIFFPSSSSFIVSQVRERERERGREREREEGRKRERERTCAEKHYICTLQILGFRLVNSVKISSLKYSERILYNTYNKQQCCRPYLNLNADRLAKEPFYVFNKQDSLN